MRSVSISSGRGFSRKRLDAAVGGEADEPVPARVGDRREQDRRLRAGRAVERDELAEIGLAQRVAVEREEAALELAARRTPIAPPVPSGSSSTAYSSASPP